MTVLIAPERNMRYSTTFDILILACAHCSMPFGITRDFEDRRRKDHQGFYCPNGHSNVYSQKSDEDKLRDEVKWLQGDVRWHEDQRKAAERDARHQRYVAGAAKGQLTKTRKRIAAGVCPVPGCKRSGLGADVVAHLATCHPDFHGHEVSS